MKNLLFFFTILPLALRIQSMYHMIKQNAHLTHLFKQSLQDAFCLVSSFLSTWIFHTTGIISSPKLHLA